MGRQSSVLRIPGWGSSRGSGRRCCGPGPLACFQTSAFSNVKCSRKSTVSCSRERGVELFTHSPRKRHRTREGAGSGSLRDASLQREMRGAGCAEWCLVAPDPLALCVWMCDSPLWVPKAVGHEGAPRCYLGVPRPGRACCLPLRAFSLCELCSLHYPWYRYKTS